MQSRKTKLLVRLNNQDSHGAASAADRIALCHLALCLPSMSLPHIIRECSERRTSMAGLALLHPGGVCCARAKCAKPHARYCEGLCQKLAARLVHLRSLAEVTYPAIKGFELSWHSRCSFPDQLCFNGNCLGNKASRVRQMQ